MLSHSKPLGLVYLVSFDLFSLILVSFGFILFDIFLFIDSILVSLDLISLHLFFYLILVSLALFSFHLFLYMILVSLNLFSFHSFIDLILVSFKT